jgi:hypothetical protein
VRIRVLSPAARTLPPMCCTAVAIGDALENSHTELPLRSQGLCLDGQPSKWPLGWLRLGDMNGVMTSKTMPRWMRALTLASVIFTVALASHAAAHGVIPDASALVRLFVLTVTVLALAPLAGASMSPTQVAALLLGGQGLLHMAFQLLSGRSVGAMPTSCAAAMGAAAVPSPTSVHAMGSQLMTPPGTASQDFAMSQVNGWHVVMLLAHLAAAIVAGVWLAAGERLFWRLLALAARPLVEGWRTVRETARDRVGTVVVGCRRFLPDTGPPRAVHGSGWAAGVVSQRGPPGYSVARDA